MADSCKVGVAGIDDDFWQGLVPARTCGPLGMNDQGDPGRSSLFGDTPGTLGVNDQAAPTLNSCVKQALHAQGVAPKPSGEGTPPKDDPDQLVLAATAYGEGSAGNVYEEMAAIASVIVRQVKARGTTLQTLLGPKSTYAFAASDGNPRTKAFRTVSAAERLNNAGMASALKAARNALDGGPDYSKGAYFWDGADLKTNPNHAKVLLGVKFTKPEHNIYKMKDSGKERTTHWMVKDKTGKLVEGKVRGTYTYVYESTAAYGGTVFWKFTDSYLTATGSKPYL